jgi:hypothetical protein
LAESKNFVGLKGFVDFKSFVDLKNFVGLGPACLAAASTLAARHADRT